MSLPTTAVVHNWRRLNNKSGLYPIYLRITIDRVQKYESILVPSKISKEQWIGEDDNWVRDDHPFFFEINTKIREQKQAIQNLIKRYYLAGKTMTFSTITSELKRSGYNKTFSAFFAEYVRRPSDNLEPATFKKYKACLEHLNSFRKDIPFQDLSPELIEEFYCYCRDVKLLLGSTIESYFKAFRKVLRLARKAQLINRETVTDLFEDLHIAVKKAK